MTIRSLAALTLLTAVLSTVQAPAQERPRPPSLVIDSVTGRDLFLFYCASCHGSDGRGAGPVAAALNTLPADLTTITRRHGGQFPAVDIAQFLDGGSTTPAHGSSEMPVWGPIFRGLDASDTRARVRIENLVAHLQSIQEAQK